LGTREVRFNKDRRRDKPELDPFTFDARFRVDVQSGRDDLGAFCKFRGERPGDAFALFGAEPLAFHL